MSEKTYEDGIRYAFDYLMVVAANTFDTYAAETIEDAAHAILSQSAGDIGKWKDISDLSNLVWILKARIEELEHESSK